MIRVVVDGYVYGKRSSEGIARYWTETLKATLQLNLPVRFDVVVPPDARRPEGVPRQTHGSLSAYWAAWRADLFHSTYYTRWPRMKCPSVATAYDFVDANFPEFKPNGPGFVDRQLDVLRRASVVVAISNATRDMAIQLAGLDPARIFVAYPGVAPVFTRPLPSTHEIKSFRQIHTQGAPYLLHVGKRRTYKNFITLLKAFSACVNQTERHLLVVGGPPEWTTSEAQHLSPASVSSRVHFIPQMDDETLRLAYAGADALVHASMMEGFGIPVIEALACGTGLILSDIPVYREIAGGMATLVALGDLEAWAQAMKDPVDVQPAWRNEVVSRYTWEGAAREHLNAYRHALA